MPELFQESFCLGQLAFQHQDRSLGQLLFGAVVRLRQVAFCLVELAGIHRADRRVQVRNRVVRIHAHRHFEHFVERLAARLIRLGHQEHLVQTQLRRVGLDDLFRLVYREVTDVVIHPVVGVAQGGIDIAQQDFIRSTAVQRFQFPLTGIPVRRLVGTDDGQQFFLIRQAALFDGGFQAFPILRLEIDRQFHA